MLSSLRSLFRRPAPSPVQLEERHPCADGHVGGCRCYAGASSQHDPRSGLLCSCVDCDDYRRLRIRRWCREFNEHQYDFVEYRRNLGRSGSAALLADAQERRRRWLESLDETDAGAIVVEMEVA